MIGAAKITAQDDDANVAGNFTSGYAGKVDLLRASRIWCVGGVNEAASSEIGLDQDGAG
jgi:hypothetical protein